VTLFGRRRYSSPVTATAHSESKYSNDNSSSNNVASTTGTDQATTLQATLTAISVTTLTAISEEIVFRGYLAALIMTLTGSWEAAWLGSAVLFGAGHWHSGSTSTFGENTIVTGFQTLNGLWYGLVYMATGSLIPGMMAHLLYDTHVLVAAWHHVNEQMDWTEEAYPTALSPAEQADIQEMQRMSGQALTTETLNFCRRFFYAFDHEHCKSLSLQDVQQAVSYSFLQDKMAPSTAQVQDMFAMVLDERNDPPRHRHDDDDGLADAIPSQDELPADRLCLTEFLRLLFALRAQTHQKVLVGPQPA
jgi:hypothetical protein